MNRIAHLLHRHILLLLVASYALAAATPTAGVALRQLQWNLGPVGQVSVTQLMLATLLFVSAMAASPALVVASWKHPGTLAAAALAKVVAAPVVVIALALLVGALGLGDDLAPLTIGLAMIAAMPVASSAPAWTRAADGNVALVLGILAISLVAGPLAGSVWAPWLTRWLGAEAPVSVTPSQAAGYFLSLVLAPSAAGMAVRAAIGDDVYAKLRTYLRLGNALLLLLLIYAFTAAAVADLAARSEGRLIVWSFVLAGLLCTSLFGLGWAAGRVLRFDGRTRIAVTYAVGMHNNGVAMLIGAEFLPADSPIFLPMISYALAQHLLAATVDAIHQRRTDER